MKTEKKKSKKWRWGQKGAELMFTPKGQFAGIFQSIGQWEQEYKLDESQTEAICIACQFCYDFIESVIQGKRFKKEKQKINK